MNILAIDDEEEVLLMLEEILVSEGHTVSVAKSTDEAQELLKGVTFDLIITDLKMPSMNGLYFVDILRSLYPNLPIIVVSGQVKSERKLLELGVSEVLRKPVSIEEITTAVKRFITIH